MSRAPTRIAALDAVADLTGPTDGVRSEGGGAITGLELVAYIDPYAGLRGLWRGSEKLADRLLVALDGEPATPVPGFVWGRGGWVGERSTPFGHRIREIGFLSDVAAACVVQWDTHPVHPNVAGRQLDIRIGGDASGGAERLAVGPDGRVLAVLSAATDLAKHGRLTPPGARERQRRSRYVSHGSDPAAIRLDDGPVAAIEAAIRTLEEAPLGDPLRADVSLFLDGFRDGSPRFVDLEDLGVVGRAALTIGRHALARACLSRLATNPSAAPLALLRLAAAHFAWTGDGGAIIPIESPLRKAILGAPPDGRATTDALAELASAVEPLGLAKLRAAAEARLTVNPGAAPRARALPMAAGGEPANQGPPVAPGGRAAPRAEPHPGPTTVAAKMLLEWMATHIGIRPEAAYGRVLLSPRFSREWRSLRISGLPVGDGALGLVMERKNHGFEIRAIQHRGRVPFNLACEPWFPASGLQSVRIDGESANVEEVAEGGGTRVRFQLPLDAERRIAVSFRAG